ncbi:MAG: hypothetical protein WCJ37_11760 [Syntrophus sp. (in: bacteria)]
MIEKETLSPSGKKMCANGRRRLPERKAAPSMKKREEHLPEEIRQMLHELRVHQIEMEIQIEELRLTKVELEASRARYFDRLVMCPSASRG